MSNGTLSVEYSGYLVGKVKLQGRKYSMQVLKGLYGSDSFEGDIGLFIEKTEIWVRYIRKQLQ